MDEAEQARAYAEADFDEPHDLFVAMFAERFGAVDGAAVDLGCGPADISIRFARANPGCTVDGIDGAGAMLALGREAVRDAGLQGRISLHRLMLPLPSPRPHPVVISNSLLHHMHDPDAFWRSVAQVAEPGARVFVMDLMRPADPAELDRLVEDQAAGWPDVLRRDFAASMHAAWRVDEVRAQLDRGGLGELTVEAISDRHLLVWGRRAS